MLELDKKSNPAKLNSLRSEADKLYSVDALVSLLENNDIIDIVLHHKGQVVKIGASAESSPGRNDLFNKAYYMNDRCVGIDELRKELSLLANSNGQVAVALIDDLPPC